MTQSSNGLAAVWAYVMKREQGDVIGREHSTENDNLLDFFNMIISRQIVDSMWGR